MYGMMYSNDKVLNHPTKKTSVYDYHKIQSSENNSQFLGQRTFMFGGPSSGNESHMTMRLHAKNIFKGPNPKPADTFDDQRGASPEINAYNNLYQHMPTGKEFPRLSVL